MFYFFLLVVLEHDFGPKIDIISWRRSGSERILNRSFMNAARRQNNKVTKVTRVFGIRRLIRPPGEYSVFLQLVLS